MVVEPPPVPSFTQLRIQSAIIISWGPRAPACDRRRCSATPACSTPIQRRVPLIVRLRTHITLATTHNTSDNTDRTVRRRRFMVVPQTRAPSSQTRYGDHSVRLCRAEALSGSKPNARMKAATLGMSWRASLSRRRRCGRDALQLHADAPDSTGAEIFRYPS
jgi:hypothetical protein